MRTALALLLLVGSLLAAPPAGAQAPAALLEDPAGDVQVEAQGSPLAPDGANAYSGADLRSLSISETRTEFTFTVTVEDLKPAEQDTAADGISVAVFFAHNGREFLLEMVRSLPTLGNGFYGYLNVRDPPATAWSGVWWTGTEVRADFEADTLTVSLPRDLLADADGATPYPGRSLEAIRVRSGSLLHDAGLVYVGDAPVASVPLAAIDNMPDDAGAAVSYAVLVGVAQTGHAYLASDIPFRASNGEATTYILTATAENLGDKSDTFTLGVAGASDRLTVVLPVQVLALEAGARHEVPVLATVPFGHQHGGVESFVLEMTSQSDPGSVGRIEMGIRFLDVPQPAGHHDTLYLHGGDDQNSIGPLLSYRQAFMSTLDDDPLATPGNYYSTGQGGFAGSWTYYFYYQLQPSLQLGLDFDLLRAGRLELPVGTTEPLLATTVEGNLYVWSPKSQDATTIAILGPSEPADLDPNGQHRFELEVEVDEDADRIPFEDGSQLYLNLRITTMTAVPTLNVADSGAYIAPGGRLQLPLNEWHDDVDDVLAALSGPGLSPLGAQERQVNPGEAAIFQVSIANPTDKATRVVLEVSGPNAAWAALPSTSVEVPAHDTARASVIVRAPTGTVPGERADLVLQAYSKEDPAARGLLRFVTIVDTTADHPDDTAAAVDLAKKESPGPSLAASIGFVALLALLVRRRQQ